MRATDLRKLLVVCGIVLLSAPLMFAHHSISSEFDLFKSFEMTGVLTKVEWINPHGQFHLETKDENGVDQDWQLETPPPSGWRRAGLASRDFLKIGDTYKVQVAPSKNGGHVALLLVLQFPDGRKMSLLGSQTNGPQQ
jgi:Family of unknown function (DUF6152)